MVNGTVNILLERELILIEFRRNETFVFLDPALENEKLRSKSESMTRRSEICIYDYLLMLTLALVILVGGIN